MGTGLSIYDVSPEERSPIGSIFRNYRKASRAKVHKRSATFVFVILVWYEGIPKRVGVGRSGANHDSHLHRTVPTNEVFTVDLNTRYYIPDNQHPILT